MSIPTVAALHALLLAAAASPDTTLEVGDLVASFDHPDDDVRFGHTCLTRGVIGKITHTHGPAEPPYIEGCPRYIIAITHFFEGDDFEERPGFNAHPPANGTPTLRGGKTFGVIRIPTPP